MSISHILVSDPQGESAPWKSLAINSIKSNHIFLSTGVQSSSTGVIISTGSSGAFIWAPLSSIVPAPVGASFSKSDQVIANNTSVDLLWQTAGAGPNNAINTTNMASAGTWKFLTSGYYTVSITIMEELTAASFRDLSLVSDAGDVYALEYESPSISYGGSNGFYNFSFVIYVNTTATWKVKYFQVSGSPISIIGGGTFLGIK